MEGTADGDGTANGCCFSYRAESTPKLTHVVPTAGAVGRVVPALRGYKSTFGQSVDDFEQAWLGSIACEIGDGEARAHRIHTAPIYRYNAMHYHPPPISVLHLGPVSKEATTDATCCPYFCRMIWLL